ncbi:MAG: aminoacyl-histidine dipeptidase [Paludibacteraceae bacterium]|nr:aminoacyl-histidine dipeptidase [Paludibacteraceae bacterium]
MMKTINDLEPKELWARFKDICDIPHPSGKEGKIGAFLMGFAQKHGLEAEMDEVGNVLIRKKATKGRESAPSVLLQAHMDMVCEKNAGTEHDFDNDPIRTVVEGDWLKAQGTTLGADDGIGVAAILAVLESDTIQHGPLECLITVDEERGLTGAQHVKAGWLQSRRLINLDSEEDGRFCIGCAGGIDTVATFDLKRVAAPQGAFFLNIFVKGLQGGHSGDDINKGRGNAIKILARFLWNESKKYPIHLCRIEGGNLHNAIPREAHATLCIDWNKKEEIRVALNHYISTIEAEYPTEKDLVIDLESTNAEEQVYEQEGANRLISALYACPHGVIEMSTEIEGLPETSTNLASIKDKEGKIVVATSQRSSTNSKKHDIKDRVEAVFALAGATVKHSDGYPGWKPNMNSELKNIVASSYERLFGEKPVVGAIHAGLECGLIIEKYPDMDMISIGPTIIGNHSPAERCEIPTVEKFWKHLIDVLGKI